MSGINICNVRVYGLEESMVASGYPMRTDLPQKMYALGEKDILRANKLAGSPMGEGHDNFLNGVVVQFDLTAPIKVWTEAQRYHFLDFVSSASTMHRLSKMTLDDAFDSSVDESIIAIVKELQEKYNTTGAKEDYLKLLMSCPVGLNLTARMTTNYRQLKTIYRQRKNHRLPHWHDFCDWIETLPWAKELGLTGGTK